MLNAYNEFQNNIAEVRKLEMIYSHLKAGLSYPEDLISDLLRSVIVYSISAFDRLIHEWVRKALLTQLSGVEPLRSITKSFAILGEYHVQLSQLGNTPADIVLKQQLLNEIIAKKLSSMTFQDPDKVKDALNYLWDEPHKWQVIGNSIIPHAVATKDKDKVLRQQLQLYVTRRNQIAHEADFDCVSGMKRPISEQTSTECRVFIEKLARQIGIDACGLAI